MRSPSLLIVLAVAVSASSACPAQPAENVAAAPPVVVLHGASAPSEPWTSAPLPVYAEASMPGRRIITNNAASARRNPRPLGGALRDC
jgi:hypothetical protein